MVTKNNKHVADLVAVAEQIAASKDSDKAQFAFANKIRGWANQLTSETVTELLEGTDNASAALDLSGVLSTFAEQVSPTASYQWDRAQVEAKLNIVEGQAVIGELSEDDLEVLNTLRPIFADFGKSNGGSRSPKTPAEVIQGRPERVITTFPDDTKPSNRAGNTKHSEGNIPQAAFDHAKAKGIQLDTEAIKEAAMSVVTGDVAKAESQGYTFTAA